MRDVGLRRLIGAAAALLLPAACAPGANDVPGAGYVTGPVASRRAALEGSLMGTDNAYARLRRARYATGGADDWDNLVVWNPRVERVAAKELAPERPLAADAPFAGSPRALPSPSPEGATLADDLLALGRQAFFLYPVQLAPVSLRLAVDGLTRYGLWADGVQGLGGLVRAEMADGSARLAFTCATCHSAARPDGSLIVGLGNPALDLGAWLANAAESAGAGVTGGAGADATATANLRAWGPGRVDVVTPSGRLPVSIPDLRPTRWLTHLHYEGNVTQRDIESLAIRIETLVITNHGQALRPPRAIILGLALFLWSLGDELPDLPAAGSRGHEVFRAEGCATCHAGPGLTGAPVDAAVVGTDPGAATDPDRGIGRYRVPSLRGVGARGRLMHDGSIANREALLDPVRAAIAGPVPHPFGLGTGPADRAALLTFLGNL